VLRELQGWRRILIGTLVLACAAWGMFICLVVAMLSCWGTSQWGCSSGYDRSGALVGLLATVAFGVPPVVAYWLLARTPKALVASVIWAVPSFLLLIYRFM
jgi:hypothetical protein